MITLVVDKSKISKDRIDIDDKSDINHVLNVYRLKVNDEIRVVDGEKEYLTQILNIEKKKIILRIIKEKYDIYTLDKNIDIAIGLIKNDKMNLLIQKLTEIGIRNILPLQTDRTVVKLEGKKDKWDIIVKEAMKQCRAIKPTNILKLSKLQNIDFNKYDVVIYAYENSESSENIIEIAKKYNNILYIIGPEGGLSPDEVNYLSKNNAIEISLGKRILRAETAAIVVAGILANT